MNDFNFFKRIYLINLDSRKDKLERATKNLNELNIYAERFPAVVGNKGNHSKSHYAQFKNPVKKAYVNAQLGCRLSHLGVIKKAKQQKAKNVLIFEDDVYFRHKKHPIDKILFDSIYFLRNYNWDMFYFGGKCKNKDRYLTTVSEHIVKIENCYQTHAYCVNHTVYDFIIDELEKGGHGLEIDSFYNRIVMPKFEVFGCFPVIAKQDRHYPDDIPRVIK